MIANIRCSRARTAASLPFEDAQWSDGLVKLVQAKLLQAFDNAQLFASVSRPVDGVTPENQLFVDIRSFYVSGSDPPSADVAIGAKLISADGKVVASRQFHHSAPAASVATPDALTALSAAFVGVETDLVAWTAETRPDRGRAGALGRGGGEADGQTVRFPGRGKFACAFFSFPRAPVPRSFRPRRVAGARLQLGVARSPAACGGDKRATWARHWPRPKAVAALCARPTAFAPDIVHVSGARQDLMVALIASRTFPKAPIVCERGAVGGLSAFSPVDWVMFRHPAPGRRSSCPRAPSSTLGRARPLLRRLTRAERCETAPYAVIPPPLAPPGERSRLRAMLGLEEAAFVVGTVCAIRPIRTSRSPLARSLRCARRDPSLLP